MPYIPVKNLLWIALGGALSLAGLQRSLATVLFAVGVGALLALWLARHPSEVREVLANESRKAAKYIREPAKSTNPSIALGLTVVSAVLCLLHVFFSTDPGPGGRGKVYNLLYSTVGHEGLIVLSAMVAAFFLCAAIEQAVDAYWARKA